uniref:DUF6385 domain-containing protein n=1 Tax=viral metagenome TaxID=1070528 RepID=A0A6H1ZU27_9ZZZZ
MPYRKTDDIELISSAQRTSSSTGSYYKVEDLIEGRVYIDITALSGSDTPTLTVTVQDSPDGTDWYTHTASGALTATGNYPLSLTNFGKYIRISYAISGTFTAGQGITFDITFVGKS